MFAGLLLVGTYTCAVSSVFAEQPHWYYWFPKKSICSVTYSVELYTCQRNLNLSSRLKWDARHLEKQAFITSKILSNKRVFFNPIFSFHIPFNNWEFGKTLTTIELVYFLIIWNWLELSILKLVRFMLEIAEELYLVITIDIWLASSLVLLI